MKSTKNATPLRKILVKIITLLMVLIMVFSLAACGGSDDKAPSEAAKSSSSKSEGKIDAKDVVEKAMEEAEELDSFSEAAVEHYLKAYGISYDDLKPDWKYEVGEKSAYADDPASGSGHAVVIFKNPDGELSDEQIREFYGQVFSVTAAVSDDGYNIIGHEFVGEGEDALAETDLETALDSWMPGWCFRKDGKSMAVYVSEIYDNNKDSEFDRLFYYYGVKFDIGVGLQKSFDETWSEMEEYFEENEDEIKEALKDYAK